MGFYHTNGDGKVLPCTSPANYPFGAYETEQEAQTAYDNKMSTESLVSHKKTDSIDFSSLSEDNRISLAFSPETSITNLSILAKDDSPDVRVSVAVNKNTPTHILSQLADDGSVYVRSSVAENENTPAQVLSQLAEDDSRSVRCSVASNNNTPINILVQLAKSKYPDVRRHITINENTPSHVLEELAKDENDYVRAMVHKNKNTPLTTLHQLYKNNIRIKIDYIFVENFVNKLVNENTEKKNIEELLSYAFDNNRFFSTIDDVYEAYDLTYGKDGLINPMIAVEIYAVQES